MCQTEVVVGDSTVELSRFETKIVNNINSPTLQPRS